MATTSHGPCLDTHSARKLSECNCEAFCTFLEPGQVFVGTQHVSSLSSPDRDPSHPDSSPLLVQPPPPFPGFSSLPAPMQFAFASGLLHEDSEFVLPSPTPDLTDTGALSADPIFSFGARESSSQSEDTEGLPETEGRGGGGAGTAGSEAWKVTVAVHSCDLARGSLCGSMEAHNVPSADTSVITFWEGEIVDNRNHYFTTAQWEATREIDIRHWSRFPAFASLQEAVQRDGGRHIDLASFPFIFMRWKEKFFVNVGPECGLTIAGFYYICFCRADGRVTGFYYDPNSSPFQKLELMPQRTSKFGYTFASFDLC